MNTVVERKDKTSSRPSLFGTNSLRNLVELIPSRLYFAAFSVNRFREDTADYHFFTAKDVLGVVNRSRDTVGKKYEYEPLDLGCLAEYVNILNNKLIGSQYQSKAIVHYAYIYDREKYDQAALLIGAYAIAALKMRPKIITTKLKNEVQHVDEDSIYGYGKSSIDLYDCLSALETAVKHKFVNFDNFSCRRYYWTKDFTWIVPDKFIAFRGPVEGYRGRGNSPLFYNEYFKRTNVKTVVRLNCVEYDRTRFTSTGIKQVELFFDHFTAPSNSILQTFLYTAEMTHNAIGVHSRTGLGRAGTLIAAYLMEHYRMTARQSVAWLRICRPGSVMGPQQPFLMDNQYMLWKIGDRLRRERFGRNAQIPNCTQSMYERTIVDFQATANNCGQSSFKYNKNN